MYARKVVLLQVLKYMPRSVELNNAIVAANAAETGRTVSVEDGVVIEMEDIEKPGPPTPDISKPVKGAANDFWAWCEKKRLNTGDVVAWLEKRRRKPTGKFPR
jgi:recombination protein RecT